MRSINRTSAFKRCFKLLERRHWDLTKLGNVILKLANDAPASELFKDHPLSGNFVGKRECHVTSITDNWILVYHKTDNNELYLHATGTHSDVFGD
ncbi:MAG: type II toxin-antitoxin system YafQ family toxin [Kiritimatiellae bacterium]|nr:type II toxin-antitoxin system YafQ family toxin [Kiritimatiellia bacterium]